MARKLVSLTLCLLASFLASSPVSSNEVRNLRLAESDSITRVVFDLSSPLEHQVFALTGPHRIVVDLPKADWGSGLAVPEAKGAVSQVRWAEKPDGTLRVVLDLRHRVTPQSFLLVPQGNYGHRLVVDLKPGVRGPRPARTAPKPVDAGRDVVIAVDPGHGGRDPGALGRRGTREKDVVLAIGKKLAQQIDATPGMRAELTRSGDYFMGLRQRMERARERKADLFVSIHADAFHSVLARGATVYTLSSKGASDEAARRLAERENASDLVGGVSLKDKDNLLARVLLDLSQNAALSASNTAGQQVINSLKGVTRVRKNTVQQAPFLVLKSPDIPSILIETAYISNPNEESALTDRSHQTRLAQAIHRGIKNYFTQSPPPGTLLAQRALNPDVPIRHVVARGDTLSEIAARYAVSTGNLKSVNSLKSDRVMIGQVLTIPSPGTFVAQRDAGPAVPVRHVIARGDTLSEIAARYAVSVGNLKSVNSLNSDRVMVGQVLTIPPT